MARGVTRWDSLTQSLCDRGLHVCYWYTHVARAVRTGVGCTPSYHETTYSGLGLQPPQIGTGRR